MALSQFSAFISTNFSQLIEKRPRDCVFAMAARGDEASLNEEIRPYGFVDANEELVHGLRMLHIASYYGHDGVVRLLIRRGATDSRAAAYPYRFWTALHFAVHAGSLYCVQGLKPTWDKLQRRDTYNLTCIHIASHGGHVDVIDEMVRLAPNEHSKLKMLNEEGHVASDDSFGQTPLDEACQGRQWACMKHLLKLGATYIHTQRLNKDLVEAGPSGDPQTNDARQQTQHQQKQQQPSQQQKQEQQQQQLASSSFKRQRREEPPSAMMHFTKNEALIPHSDDDDDDEEEEEEEADNEQYAKRPNDDDDDDDASNNKVREKPRSTWHKKFEELAQLAIAAGVNEDQVDLIRMRPKI
ncbi:hypothetical protein CTAYLR_001257 [Chrysophaeum taylorii]|uniref:Uncharacterized protein n=1 Tax=Chrysophaeum taylorii TaxID=2483200 RepID=A0AAD7UDF1_9STRA|nr:hypothetical protein CTAYLR_001257 [Chrysophaeum taylorii]